MTEPKRPYPNGVPIAPDTVMPPRRSVRWGATADSPPTEIHDDPGLTRAYLAGLAAGRTEAAADFDRLRDERDRAIEQRENANRASVRVELELARLRTERDELRRAVGRDRSTPSGGGQPDARGDGTERHHDTLTEEKT